MAVGAALLLAPSAAQADPAEEIIEETLRQIRQLYATDEIRDQANTHAYSSNTDLGIRSLEPNNSTAMSAKAEAAVRASPNGVAGGVSVAPLAFTNEPLVRGLNVNVASLDGVRFQYGVGYAVTLPGSDPTRLETAMRTQCAFKETELRTTLSKLVSPVQRTCKNLVKVLVADNDLPEDKRASVGGAVAQLKAVCGETEAVSMDVFAAQVVAVWSVVQQHNPDKFSGDLDAISRDVAVLAGYKAPEWARCIKDKQSPERVWRRWLWRQPRHSVGGTVLMRHFPVVFGFSEQDPGPGQELAEEDDLSRGKLARVELRAEYALELQRSRISVSLGVPFVRDRLGDSMLPQISPSVSASVACCSLTGVPLVVDGELNVDDDGELPPYLTFGGSMGIEYAFSSREGVEFDTKVRAFRALAFTDFRLNSTFGFRLGVPLEARPVTREAVPPSDESPGVAERTALQWSVPVSLTTVIQIN